MESKYFDWRGGRVVFWDLDDFDPREPVRNQVDILKEDLAQIEYAKDIIIDIGWYPEFSIKGCFVIKVVNTSNWEEPLAEYRARNAPRLVCGIKAAIDAIVAPRVRRILSRRRSK